MGKFSISQPLSGEVLQGNYHIAIDVYEPYVPFGTFWLQIDDAQIKSSVLQPWLRLRSIEEQLSQREMIFTVDTQAYENGSHSIGVCDNRDNSKVHSIVYFENVISAVWYDPLFIASPDVEKRLQYSQIYAVISPAQEWVVEIQTSYGDCVKEFHGQGNFIDIQWQGYNNEGLLANDDQYELIIRAIQSDVKIVAGGIIKSSE